MDNPQPYTSPPWNVATKSIVVIVVLLLATLVIWRFQFFISPLLLAIILAYLLHPVISFVERRTSFRRGASVLLVYLALALLVLGGIFVAGIAISEQAITLSQTLPDLFQQAIAQIQTWSDWIRSNPIAIGPLSLDLSSLPRTLDWNAISGQAAGVVEPIFSSSGSFIGQVAQTTFSVIGWSVLIFVFSIYIARDIPQMGGTISDLAHQPGYREDADRLVREFVKIWNAYLRGQVILGLVIGTVVSITLAILGVNNALALGLLSGLLEFLPVAGPVIGSGAAILVALFQPENYLGLSPFYYALLILVVMVIIQQVENNILVPRIVGGALDLHPLIVIMSVIMGASLAGVLGAVLAAPVIASAKLFGTYAWRKLLDLPPFAEPKPEAEDEPTVLHPKIAQLWEKMMAWGQELIKSIKWH